MDMRAHWCVTGAVLVLVACTPFQAKAQTTSPSPHRVPAFQVSVKTNYYDFPAGDGANWQYIRLPNTWTGQTAQGVFNWLDSNWADVVSQTLNTNGWTNLYPTASTVQATFNFIDGHYSTNPLTALLASNMFLSSTSQFIRDIGGQSGIGGQVSNNDLAANSVTWSNIVDGSISNSDIATGTILESNIRGDVFNVLGVRTNYSSEYGVLQGTNDTVNGTAGGGAMINWTQLGGTNNASLVQFWSYLQPNPTNDGVAVRIGGIKIRAWISKDSGTTSNEVGECVATSVNLAGSGNDTVVPGTMSFAVPRGYSYKLDWGALGNMSTYHNWSNTWISVHTER